MIAKSPDDPFKIFSKVEINKLKALNPELSDFLEDVEEIVEMTDYERALDLAIDLFKQYYYRQEKDKRNFYSFTSSLLVLYTLIRALKNQRIISRHLGFIPDFNSILMALIKLLSIDEETAILTLKKLKNNIFSNFLTNELLDEPSFIAILFLIELYDGRLLGAIKALEAYLKLEFNKERERILLSSTIKQMKKRVISEGSVIDILNTIKALTNGLPDDTAFLSIRDLLSTIPHICDTLDDNALIILIEIVVTMKIILDEIQFPKEIVKLINNSKSELKYVLLKILKGEIPNLNELSRIYRGDLILPLAMLGVDISQFIDSYLDASSIIKSLEQILRKILEINIMRAIPILNTAINISRKFWNELDPQSILSVYHMLLMVSGLYDKSLILKYPNIFIRGFILGIYYESENLQKAAFALLLKSISYYDDIEALKIFSQATYGLRSNEIDALRVFINARIKMLSGSIEEAIELFEKVEKIAEDLDELIYCYFMLEISRNYLKLGIYDKAYELLSDLSLSDMGLSLSGDIEYTRIGLLVEVYLALGKFEDAERMINELEEILRRDVTNAVVFSEGMSEILAVRAKLELMRGNYKEALEFINEAISLLSRMKVSFKEYEIIRANILAKLGEEEEAVDALLRILHEEKRVKIKSDALAILIELDANWVDMAINLVEESIKNNKINDVRRLIYLMLYKLVNGDSRFLKVCRIVDLVNRNLDSIVNNNIRKEIESKLKSAKNICRSIKSY